MKPLPILANVPGSVELPPAATCWINLHRTHLSGDITKSYNESLKEDFFDIVYELEDILKPGATLLDIGCGMAGIDVLLYRHFGCNLLLLDGDGPIDDWRGGYEQTMKPFSSRTATNELLEMNGVSNIHWLNVGTRIIPPVAAAISLLSMGHHYPIDTYKVDCDVLIADCRLGMDGIKTMNRPHKILRTTTKSQRVAFYR